MDTALILAGGESQRFGRPKAMVDVAGRSMLERVADAVAPLAGELVISVGTAEKAGALQQLLPASRIAVDQRRGVGPIEGFLRGFTASRGDRVLVAPCDAPLLRSELYRLLLVSIGGSEAAVPKLDVFDPVRAVYRRSAVLRVFGATPGVASPSALVDHLRAVFVGSNRIRTVDPDLVSFFDVNTRDDLDEVLRRMPASSG